MTRAARRPLPALALALLAALAQLLASCSLGGAPASTPTPAGTATVAAGAVQATPAARGPASPAGGPGGGSPAASPAQPAGAAATPASPAAASAGPVVLTPPPKAARPSPRGAQTLTIAGSRSAPALDPALARDANSTFLVHQLFRGLVRLDEQLNPVPDLAGRIEISPDGLTYRFTLRPDAVFHDGRPITAQAVKYSLERATDPALLGGAGSQLPGATYLADIDGATDRLAGRARELRGVRALDGRTV